MDLLTALVASGTLGLASTAHCAAMCGPLAAVACRTRSSRAEAPSTSDPADAAAPSSRFDSAGAAGYFGGRLFGYAVLGAIVGSVGAGLAKASSSPLLRIALGILVAAVLCVHASSWIWPRHPRLLRLRKRRPTLVNLDILSRIARRLPRSAASRGPALGMMTALFPCGASAAALLAAAQAGSAATGAAMMATFAIASAPGLVAATWAGARALGLKLVPGTTPARLAGVSLLLLAVWMAASPVAAWARSNAGSTCHCHRGGDVPSR